MAKDKLQSQYLPVVKRAEALEILTTGDLTKAVKATAALQALKNMVVENFAESKQSAKQTHKAITDQEKGHTDVIEQGIEVIKQKILAYAEENELPEVDGLTIRKLPRISVTDKMLLVMMVINEELPESLVDINMKELKRLADAGLIKDGIETTQKPSVAISQSANDQV